MEKDYFSEEVQPDFYSEEIQKQIPNHENFLQRAIKQSRIGPFGGTSITAALPANKDEMVDLGKVGLRQAIPETPGLVGFGANLVDNREAKIKLPEPQTEYGKNLETSANIAQITHAVAPLAVGGFKLASKGINALRTSPLFKEIRTVEELMNPLKEEAKNVGRQISEHKVVGTKKAEETAYEGSKAIKQQMTGRMKDANKRFGEEFSKLNSNLADSDFESVLRKTADDIGDQYSPTYKKLNQLADNLGVSTDKMGNKIANTIFSKEEVQGLIKRVYESLPGERERAIFNQHMAGSLNENVPGLAKIKAQHAPIYKLAKDVKTLGKGALKRVAIGSASGSEVKDLGMVAERLGSSHVQRAEKVAESNALKQRMLEQNKASLESKIEELGSKIPDIERRIKQVRFRQGAVATGASLAGLGGLVSRLMNLDKHR